MEKMIFSSLHEIGHCTTIENIVLHSMAKIAKQNIFSLLSGKRIIAKTSYFQHYLLWVSFIDLWNKI